MNKFYSEYTSYSSFDFKWVISESESECSFNSGQSCSFYVFKMTCRIILTN